MTMNTYMDAVEHISTTESAYTVITPAPRTAWDELYQADPTAIFQQSAQWLDYACTAGGYTDVSRYYELPNGKRLVLPLVKRKGIPNLLAVAESYPYAWGIGGLLASAPLEAADVAVVNEDLMSIGYLGVSIRPNPLQGEVWAAAQPDKAVTVSRCAHMLDLEGGYDYIFEHRFSRSRRKQVRRAERLGMHAECDTTGRLIPVFYGLFERSLVRWAKRQHEPLWMARIRGHARDPQDKIQKMADMLGETCRVWVIWYEGRPAAAKVTLRDKNCSALLGVSDKELATTNANALLQSIVIKDACDAGCHYLDLGETGFNEQLAYYKTEFGAEAYTYADYHYDRVPITQWDHNLRSFVKGLIGFKDV